MNSQWVEPIKLVETMMNKKNSDENTDDVEFVSKTQLKNEAKALQKFGESLVNLPLEKLEKLPLTDNTITAIKGFHKQSGNIAKRRHLAYIGKCLRHDDVEAAQQLLHEESFQPRRTVQDNNASTINKLIEDLLENGDQKIQVLLTSHPQLERQKIRQLIRNIKSAKTNEKIKITTHKLKMYLESNNIV